MWLEVHSPHSGRLVRIRDKDVGRSVQDEEGRVFFVLQREDGSGHYGSLTRAGGPQQEAKYDQMLAKQETLKASGAAESVRQFHDARGKRRSSIRGKLVILFLFLLVAVLAYLFTVGPFGAGSWPWQKPPSPSSQGQPTPPTAPGPGPTPAPPAVDGQAPPTD